MKIEAETLKHNDMKPRYYLLALLALSGFNFLLHGTMNLIVSLLILIALVPVVHRLTKEEVERK